MRTYDKIMEILAELSIHGRDKTIDKYEVVEILYQLNEIQRTLITRISRLRTLSVEGLDFEALDEIFKTSPSNPSKVEL